MEQHKRDMAIESIDLSVFNQRRGDERSEALRKLLESCTSHGFIKVGGHGFSDERVARLFAWVRVGAVGLLYFRRLTIYYSPSTFLIYPARSRPQQIVRNMAHIVVTQPWAASRSQLFQAT